MARCVSIQYKYGKYAMKIVEKVWTEPSAAHSTLRERVPAGTALPADGSDGSLGLVDDGRARRLDGATDDRRQHHCLRWRCVLRQREAEDVRVDPAGLACTWNARSRHSVTYIECRRQAAE